MGPMLLRTLLFLAVLALVLGGASVYLATRSMALCPALARHPGLVWGFFGAFVGLTFASPMGPISFRAADHQSTMGAWVGKIALKDGVGEMIDWSYADGAKYLPPPDQAKKMRPAD